MKATYYEKLYQKLPLKEKVKILTEYTIYVTDYPDYHEEDQYPASFPEWFANDYQEEHGTN